MQTFFRSRRFPRRNQESGMALMLAIAMLLLLSILGATVLEIASRDVRSSGQIGAESQVFYTADRIVSFGQHFVDMMLDELTDANVGSTKNLADPADFNGNSVIAVDKLNDALNGMESGTIAYVGRTQLEILRSSKRTPAKGNVFHIEAIAADNAAVPTRIAVDTSYVKIVSVLAEDKTVTDKDLKKLADAANR
jgi:Tfp pilus assembly protein PilX